MLKAFDAIGIYIININNLDRQAAHELNHAPLIIHLVYLFD